MNKKLYIQNYCNINNNEVFLNGNCILKAKSLETKSFLKEIYKSLNIKYPKFFKMDNLSKLAFIGAELVLKNRDTSTTDVGIVFSNNASSLETDRKHQNSINDVNNYYPSPAVFVYTLPNIGIGEISIRHQLKSENAFFIFEKYNAAFHYTYESGLITTNKSEKVLGGWVNVDSDGCDAFIYLVSEAGTKEYSTENLLKLYNN